jgi:hypothetical protein
LSGGWKALFASYICSRSSHGSSSTFSPQAHVFSRDLFVLQQKKLLLIYVNREDVIFKTYGDRYLLHMQVRNSYLSLLLPAYIGSPHLDAIP